MSDGADFMLGDLGLKKDKKAAVKLRDSGDLDLDAVERLMDSKKDGEALRKGLDGAVSALDALRRIGLTSEAIIVLVTEKCRPDKNGNATSRATVQRVLEGLFRLSEYVR